MATNESILAGEAAEAERATYFTRFSLSQRLEHALILVTFTGLLITGLPQKFFDAGWAQWIILNLGGIEITRFIHRFLAFLFMFGSLYHVGSVTYGLLKGGHPSMVPSLKDAQDAVITLRYSLGLSLRKARFDRFDYRQKFEYWGLVSGAMVIIMTGLILMYPIQVTQLLPGELVPAAKEAHGNEALLAFLVIIIWHLYGAHFGPGKFPADTTIFTGKISKVMMIEEHPLEYERITGKSVEAEHDSGKTQTV